MLLLSMLPQCIISDTLPQPIYIEITGNISDLTFKPHQEVYVASADLIVPPETNVTIPEGTIILFKNNSGLFIEGSCKINGSSFNPVIFSSYNDSLNKKRAIEPSQYDWTGIRIAKTAAPVKFNHLHIKYAIKPIESLSPGILLNAIRRFNTMEEWFTINGEKHSVPSETDFYFPPLPPTEIKRAEHIIEPPPPTPQPSPTIPTPPAVKKPWWRTTVCRITLGATGSAALLTSGICLAGRIEKNSEYENHLDDYTSEAGKIASIETMNDLDPNKEDLINARKMRHNFTVASITSGSIGILFLSLFGLTFYF